MVRIVEIDGADWLDEHRTCDRKALRIIKVEADPDGRIEVDLPQRSAAIGEMMDELAAEPEAIAITGSTWSQADLFASPATRVDTAMDQVVWSLPAEILSDDFTGNAQHFCMATGGATLDFIMEFLDGQGLSFRTAGSHKGQSIAGAIATGTHGSLLGEMGLETHIRGLVFINGAGAAHWIADPDCPVLSRTFIETFATPADPALFKDCVIHLGGLGYCAAVLLEAVPRFGLSWKKTIAPLASDWWDAVAQADFDRAAAPVIGDVAPAFYELTFDPNEGLDADVMQTVYWRDDLPANYQTPDPAQATAKPRDALDVLASGINAFSEHMITSRGDRDDEDEDDDGLSRFGKRLRLLDIAKMTFDDFREEIAQNPQSHAPESLMALTGDWEPRSVFGIRIDTFNAALAVPVSQLRRTLELGCQVAQNWRKHFVFTVRFAKQSRIPMSFLRFEDTAIINIDGLTRAGIAGWISHSDEFSRDFTNHLEQAQIPFSMHWGKDIPSNAAKIAADFGDAAVRYKAARDALVPATLRAKLCPPQLAQWGLA